MNYLEALLSPQKAELLADVRQKAFATEALLRFKQRLFLPCPILRGILVETVMEELVFREFLAWAESKSLSMGWSLHLYLLEWLLKEFPQLQLNEDIWVELIAISASRWANTDQSRYSGILIKHPLLDNKLIMGWKARTLSEDMRIELAEIAQENSSFTNQALFALVRDFTLDSDLEWYNIPH